MDFISNFGWFVFLVASLVASLVAMWTIMCILVFMLDFCIKKIFMWKPRGKK